MNFFKKHFELKFKNFESVYSKDTFGVKFSIFLKVSFETTLLESVFQEDTFHVAKTILHLGIFLNLYYLRIFCSFLH